MKIERQRRNLSGCLGGNHNQRQHARHAAALLMVTLAAHTSRPSPRKTASDMYHRDETRNNPAMEAGSEAGPASASNQTVTEGTDQRLAVLWCVAQHQAIAVAFLAA